MATIISCERQVLYSTALLALALNLRLLDTSVEQGVILVRMLLLKLLLDFIGKLTRV